MMRIVRIAFILGLGCSGAGCTSNPAHLGQSVLMADSGQARQDETVLAYHPSLGFVRGTRRVIAGLGRPLEPAPGLNRTVAACRAAVQAEAVKLGAREVEAVSAGPAWTNKQGQVVGPVRVRISYDKGFGIFGTHEVREAAVNCAMEPDGRIAAVSARADRGGPT